MEKKIYKIAVLLFLVCPILFSQIGCTKKEGIPEDKKQQKKVAKIGVTLAAETTYLPRVAEAMEAAAKECDIVIEIQYADWDTKIQTNQIEDYISEGVSAIILAPVNAKSVLTPLKKAAAASIPVINVNMKVDAISSEYIQTYVGASSAEEGEMAAKFFLDLLGAEGGKIGIVEGAPGSDPQIYRTESFADYLNAYAQIEIAGIGNGEWNRDKARLVTIDLMRRNPDLKGIYCHDSEMAMGVIAALEELGKGEQIKVVSIAENEEYIKALNEGRLAGIITQSADYEGAYSVYAAVDKMQGKTIRPWYKDPIEILIPEN